MSAEKWVRDQRGRTAEQLKDEGFIAYDEYGQARLTLKGKKRAAARLDKLPMGDDLLLEIAICEAYHTQPQI